MVLIIWEKFGSKKDSRGMVVKFNIIVEDIFVKTMFGSKD
jgi:hypothetical protein